MKKYLEREFGCLPLHFTTRIWVCSCILLVCLLLLTHPVVAVCGESKVILAFGDSITVGAWENDIKAGNGNRTGGYEPDLENLTDSYNNHYDVLNYGVAGERTLAPSQYSSGGLTRLIYHVLPNNQDASYILLMEGTNDIWSGISRESTVGALGLMVDVCREYGIEPILSNLTPDTTSALSEGKNIPLYNSMIEEMAKQKNVAFVDMYSAMVDEWEEKYAYGLVPWGTYIDYLHPSRAGYHKIAELWFETLNLTKYSEIPWVYLLLQ